MGEEYKDNIYNIPYKSELEEKLLDEKEFDHFVSGDCPTRTNTNQK